MRESLLKWIGDADALRNMDRFSVREIPLFLAYQLQRRDDLYIALVGELFDSIRSGNTMPADWARLGNALSEFSAPDRANESFSIGVSPDEATLFAAAAFYFGGFPASSCLTMRGRPRLEGNGWAEACYDLLARPREVAAPLAVSLQEAVRDGELARILTAERAISAEAKAALSTGPKDWIPLRLLQSLLDRFRTTNLRAVLPSGELSFWKPLVNSFLARGTWDFFPSQIAAIERGLLQRHETFSLQMPTGAGKTALCETLLFYHLRTNPGDVAVLLVPYRSLASELRRTLVKNLNDMGISTRCAYGGTVPSGDEVRSFDETHALVATPETLSGILSANPAFARRISLVICDEGHLLDTESRGVGLELLLARMKARHTGSQRYVFLSAIIPNIEEVNAWLGGADETVVRSDYRPALAEFAVIRTMGQKASSALDLEMHPHEVAPVRYRIAGFLRPEDFRWTNPRTGRQNTYPFSSIKTRSIAAARKALPMGAVVVFAANKRGSQGAIGLAQELIKQIDKGLPLPIPLSCSDESLIKDATEYLGNEYGMDWIGTLALGKGAAIHHGDIPQETREVLEKMLREGKIAFGICTSTLAEGVNFPIRTLVLYSGQRLGVKGKRTDLLIRDIKNLVGRAGRAGSTTRGLVICANQDQWPLVEDVANQAPGEPVVGALRSLIERVRAELVVRNQPATNELLERSPAVHPLIDGIDATLIELAATEIGEVELARLATELADQTFASSQTDKPSQQLLREVFVLRAQRTSAVWRAGRLNWIRETGARLRMMDVVETDLLPSRQRWDDISDPIDPSFVKTVLDWAWSQPDLQHAVKAAYRVPRESSTDTFRAGFTSAVTHWLSGSKFSQIALAVGLPIDDLLHIHSQVVTFALQTIVEQGIALLEKMLESTDSALAPAVTQFAEHLRFGVPTAAGRCLAAGGITHRRAFVELGSASELDGFGTGSRKALFRAAHQVLRQNPAPWRKRLGVLVYENTLQDFSALPQ